MDIVYIRELRIEAVIGVYDWERTIKQTVVLDIDMGSDNRRAAANDAIVDAIDYAGVSQRVTQYIEGSQFQLIETLAERVAELILEEFSVPWVKLAVSKPGAVATAKDVGVCIERGVPD